MVQHFKETEREREQRGMGTELGGKYHGYCNRWLSNQTVASVEWGEGGQQYCGQHYWWGGTIKRLAACKDPNCHKDTTLMDGCHATIVINGIKHLCQKVSFVDKSVSCVLSEIC